MSYPLTSFKNLEGIIRSGSIYCDSEIKSLNIEVCSYSKQDLKTERSYFPVPVGVGGVIADYVPFFFTNRPPMLYSIKYKNGPEIQRSYVHLITSVETIFELDIPFCFTDGHAIMAYTDYYEDLEYLDEVIDWDLIDNTYWADTDEDMDRKRRKQAEFLVYNNVPWDCIESIAVKDNIILEQVEKVFHKLNCEPSTSGCDIPISVKPEWYY